jgi:pyruvate dehydrogenase E2 component (dihydrolipoamide acetyltransferase)
MPVAKDGGVFIEPVMNLCLTYDHRVINGAPACRYLQSVVDILNETDWR